MAGRFELHPFKTGEVLELKKKHPCGGSTWQVIRVGADIGIQCQTCQRFQSLPRRKLEKAMRAIASPDQPAAKEGES